MMKRLALLLLLFGAPAASQTTIAPPGVATGLSFAASGYANGGTSSLTEVNLASVKIPANSIGANGVVEIAAAYSITANTNNKTATVRYAATQGALSGGLGYAITVGSSNASIQMVQIIRNANATNSQVSFLGNQGYGNATTASGTSTLDTTQDTWINLNGSVAVGTDVLTLLGWSVKVWKN